VSVVSRSKVDHLLATSKRCEAGATDVVRGVGMQLAIAAFLSVRITCVLPVLTELTFPAG
jgi:hypothetical protein